MCITYWLSIKKNNVELGYDFLNTIWMSAIQKGIISGDINNDGDMDDGNELLVLDKNKLLILAGIDMKYLGSFDPKSVEKKSGVFFIGEFYNPSTRFTHFVGLDENLKCEYDPIANSNTVKNGFLKTVRVFA
jgi:hypothetical protein